MRLLLAIVMIAQLAPFHDSSAQDLAGKVYRDPKGFFEIVPPAEWRVQEYPRDPRGKVAFIGPNKIDLRVLVNTPDYNDIDGLINFAKSVEKKIDVNTNIKKIEFNGHPAIQRSLKFRGFKFYYVDFLIGRVAHNLGYGSPPKYYKKYLRVALASIATYNPLRVEVSDREAKIQFLAKVRRLWELKQHDFALGLLNDVLRKEPGDPEYLDLKAAILKSR